MKTKILSNLDSLRYSLEHVNYQKIHITDWSKETNKERSVEVSEDKPEIDSVCVHNMNRIDTVFVAFKDNALVITAGHHSKQCECVLFPKTESKHWVLCVETKYTDVDKAFKEEYNYPFTMINQIIDTVKYFRDKGIINRKQVVDAILSFPKYIDDFNTSFFNIVEAKDSNLSITNIMLTHKIKMKATNMAEILSDKRIKLK